MLLAVGDGCVQVFEMTEKFKNKLSFYSDSQNLT